MITQPEQLGSCMSKLELEALIAKALENFSNGEDAAKYDALVKEAQNSADKQQRADRLEALGIELEADSHQAVVNDNGLIEGISLKAVRRWLWNPRLEPILVLVGQSGCGKSLAASWAIAGFQRSSCLYTARDVVRIFASNIERDDRKAQSRMKKAHLTVLDDVATEENAVAMCAALIEILGAREQKRTIITTNQSEADWLKRYPDTRLHSRLKRAHFVYDNGPDLRAMRRAKADAERKAAR